jgi:hypothetical protein
MDADHVCVVNVEVKCRKSSISSKCNTTFIRASEQRTALKNVV